LNDKEIKLKFNKSLLDYSENVVID
jgi:hypothetical protein